MKTVEIIISGRVQKVGFRACARKIALDLKVTGTVVNLTDGRVQIYATAEPMILEKFTSMLFSCPRAVIREVKTRDLPVKKYDEFSIIKSEGQVNTTR